MVAAPLSRARSRLAVGVAIVSDQQLTGWASAMPDADGVVAPVAEELKEAVEILEDEFGGADLVLQGSYARSTAIRGSDVDYLLYARGMCASEDTVLGDSTQGFYERFRFAAEDALRGWMGVGDTARRAIWTRVGVVEVHVLPVLPYTAANGDEGAWFLWGSGVDPTITFSEVITARIEKRDEDSNGRYREVVRILKNISEDTYWESDNLPGSSMIESLVYAAGLDAVSSSRSLRGSCAAVLKELDSRLAGRSALGLTDPSGHTVLFDGVHRDPEYDEATGFVSGVRRRLV